MKRALDFIINFRRALAKVGPFFRLFKETMFVGSLCTPNHSRRCAGWIEPGMGTVAFMSIAELFVNLRVDLYHVDMVVSAKNLTQEYVGKHNSIFQTLKMILTHNTGKIRYAKAEPHSELTNALQSFRTPST